MVPQRVCTSQKVGQACQGSEQWFTWGLGCHVMRKLVNGREYRAKRFEDDLSALSLFFRKIISGCNPLYTMGSMGKKKRERRINMLSFLGTPCVSQRGLKM